MSSDTTTIKNDLFTLSQHKLDEALGALKRAQAAYQANHSDTNLQALEDTRKVYLSVEASVRSLLGVK